nr:isoprenylcysteine carboxylmethyltransferase family protein [Bacillus sp. B15-48]
MIILQRLTELRIAKKNEEKQKQNGAIECGMGHYPWMVMIHTAFILATIAEVVILNKQVSNLWPGLLLLFLFTQIIRGWAIISLGPYWNTKIIVVPNAKITKKGPYRFIKHPNYLVVTLEIIIIPLMFNAWITAAIFSFLNICILSVRIPAEERALEKWTSYQSVFQGNRRFLPHLLNKYDNS